MISLKNPFSAGLNLYAKCHLSVFGFLIFIVCSFIIPSKHLYADSTFSQITIEPPFENILLKNPDLMQFGGADLLEDESGRSVIIGVGKVIPDPDSNETQREIHKKGEIYARASVLEFVKGINLETERTAEKESNLSGTAKTNFYSESMNQAVVASVEGKIQQLPVIGNWWNSEQTVFYVAVGKILFKSEMAETELNEFPKELLEDEAALFKKLIELTPTLKENGGVKSFKFDDRIVLISVGMADINGAVDKARKIARLNAIKNVLSQREGVRVATIEYLKDSEVFLLEDNEQPAKSITDLFSINEENAEGFIKALPIVASWDDEENRIYCVALGAIAELEK